MREAVELVLQSGDAIVRIAKAEIVAVASGDENTTSVFAKGAQFNVQGNLVTVSEKCGLTVARPS